MTSCWRAPPRALLLHWHDDDDDVNDYDYVDDDNDDEVLNIMRMMMTVKTSAR